MRMGRTALTIDLHDYLHLPWGVRARFDAWLDAECLRDKLIVELTLTEGAVIVEQLKQPFEVVDGEPVWVTSTYPVRSLPPLDAFNRADTADTTMLDDA